MCRLFGLSAGRRRVDATFWLLGAPDSLAVQSQRNPDGTGLGTFDEHGSPVLERQPLEADEDTLFLDEARERRSSTFLGHVRFKTTGRPLLRNCHPFLLDGRFFAHNGMVAGLADLEEHLGEDLRRVVGDTDSERCAALVAREVREHDGDVTAGLVEATRWIATHCPVYALTIVLTTEHELWALRYPETHGLHYLDRRQVSSQPLHHRGSGHTIDVDSRHLASAPSVVVASEPMDDDPGWQELSAGELLHVDADLQIQRWLALPDPPRQRIASPQPGGAG